MNFDHNHNINLLSNELKLLLSLIKCSCVDELRPWLEEKIDWELFLQLVRHHRVYPSVYHSLKKLESESVPHNVMQFIYKDYQMNTFQMLNLSREMEGIAKLFNENKIMALFLKGPILANELYGDISLRTSGDLDVIVPIAELEKIDSLLIQSGYVKDDYIHTILNDWKWRHHHVTYFHPTKRIKLEIHWRLNPGPAKEPSFNELWKRRRTSRLASTPIFILSKEDLFLFLVLHGARHGWSRLRWLFDIKMIMKQSPNWIKIQKLLKRYQCLHVAGQAIILASQLFDTSIPTDLTRLTNSKRALRLAQNAQFYIRQMVNLHSVPLPDEIAVYHSHYLFALMPLKQKILFTLSFLFPYPVDAETLPLPKPLHFLYFPLRPFLWSFRKTRKGIPEGAKR